MPSRIRKSQKGLSLIEVLISMLILSIGVLGLAPLLALAIYGNSYSNEVTNVNLAAQERIEWYKNAPVPEQLPFVEDLQGVAGNLSLTTRIDDNISDNSVPTGLYQIKVTVSWTDKEQKTRSMEFYTYRE